MCHRTHGGVPKEKRDIFWLIFPLSLSLSLYYCFVTTIFYSSKFKIQIKRILKTYIERSYVRVFFLTFYFRQSSSQWLALLICLIPQKSHFEKESAGLRSVVFDERFSRTFSEILFVDDFADRRKLSLFEVAVDVVPSSGPKHLKVLINVLILTLLFKHV